MGDKETDVKKQQPHEMHNSELVRLYMAATPSYFFAPPQAGHNFFFSELLRSLVQKRKADELNSAMKLKAVSKKIRKPSYNYQKPLETEWRRQKINEEHKASNANENEDPKSNSLNMNLENSQDSVINVDKDDSPPAQTSLPNSIIPQANTSAFYPYVDPLHFFIDLRVSASQVHDRKKEAYLNQALKNNILLDSNTWSSPSIIGKNRVGSAFKVPVTFNEANSNFSAINLIANNEQVSIDAARPRADQGNDSLSDKSEDVDIQIFDSVEARQDQDKRND